jgi:hypothetical protein
LTTKPGAEARQLMRKVGMRYYNPPTEAPGFFCQFLAAIWHIRLEPQPQLPRPGSRFDVPRRQCQRD